MLPEIVFYDHRFALSMMLMFLKIHVSAALKTYKLLGRNVFQCFNKTFAFSVLLSHCQLSLVTNFNHDHGCNVSIFRTRLFQ